MIKFSMVSGAIFALLSVVLGAFAAHGLKHQLSAELLAVFQTGVQYQFYHALALLLCGVLMKQYSQAPFKAAAMCFFAGVIFFSGSLYALALTGQKWFGPITPVGGVCFIAGWAIVSYRLIRSEL